MYYQKFLRCIKYFNIIYNNSYFHKEFNFINFSDTLEHIHLTTNSIENFKQTNLPSNLKILFVTIVQLHAYLENEVINIFNSNFKIPYECKLELIFT